MSQRLCDKGYLVRIKNGYYLLNRSEIHFRQKLDFFAKKRGVKIAMQLWFLGDGTKKLQNFLSNDHTFYFTLEGTHCTFLQRCARWFSQLSPEIASLIDFIRQRRKDFEGVIVLVGKFGAEGAFRRSRFMRMVLKRFHARYASEIARSVELVPEWMAPLLQAFVEAMQYRFENEYKKWRESNMGHFGLNRKTIREWGLVPVRMQGGRVKRLE